MCLEVQKVKVNLSFQIDEDVAGKFSIALNLTNDEPNEVIENCMRKYIAAAFSNIDTPSLAINHRHVAPVTAANFFPHAGVIPCPQGCLTKRQLLFEYKKSIQAMQTRMPAVECNCYENNHAADRLYSNDEWISTGHAAGLRSKH